MKKCIFASVVISGFILFSLFCSAETITVLHLGDTHSCLSPGAPRNDAGDPLIGGIARAATVIGMEKATNPNTLALHAGDMFIGDVFFNRYFGVPELQLLNSMGLDAMTLGNHEFDLGPGYLQYILYSGLGFTGFPILSANSIIPAIPDLSLLDNYVQPYIIKPVGGVNVGILGMTTPMANVLSQPGPVVISQDLVNIILANVTEMRSNGAQIVILLSHLGYHYDKLVAQNIPGIDIIISAHDHFNFQQMETVANPYGGNTYIVQSGAFYRSMGKFTIDWEDDCIANIGWQNIALDQTIPEVPEIAGMVAYMQSQIESDFTIPFFTGRIGRSLDFMAEEATNLQTSGNKTTETGKLICEALLDWGRTDFAAIAGGSIAQPIYKGPVYYDDVFRSLGYGFNTDNYLGFRVVKLKIKGSVFKQALLYTLSDLANQNDDFLVQVEGMKYKARFNRADNSVIDVDITINNKPMEDDKYYSLTSDEQLLLFAMSLGFEVIDVEVVPGLTTFQVVSDYIANRQVLTSNNGQRVTFDYVTVNPKDKDKNPHDVVFYPNPVKEMGAVSLKIRQDGIYTLDLYDMQGNKLMELLSEYLYKGLQTKYLDFGTVDNGSYYYRLIGNDCLESGVVIVSH